MIRRPIRIQLIAGEVANRVAEISGTHRTFVPFPDEILARPSGCHLRRGVVEQSSQSRCTRDDQATQSWRVNSMLAACGPDAPTMLALQKSQQSLARSVKSGLLTPGDKN